MKNITTNELLTNHLTNLPSDIQNLTLQNLPFGFALINNSGIIKFSNNIFANIFDKKTDEIINTEFSALLSPDQRSSLNEEIDYNSPTLEPIAVIEKQLSLWNKKTIWIELHVIPIKRNKENYLLYFIKDITTKKLSELEIQKNANYYKTLFNNTKDAIFLCHLNYGKTLSNFFDSNDEAIVWLSYSKKELFNKNPNEIFFEGNEEKTVEFIDKLQLSGSSIFTASIRRKNGEFIPSEINSYQFDYSGRPTIVFIARDLSERKRYESQLKNYGENLRDLALHLQSVREEERTIISREIHDELGQVLTVLKIQISLMAKIIVPNQPELQSKFDSITNIVDGTVETVQKLCAKLRPGILDELGLSAAIEWQTNEFSKHTGITCSLEIPKAEIEIASEKKTAVFRIFQEALTNIARHANANRVNIILNWDDEKLLLSIKDNGKGITKNQIQNSKSLGILGMKERSLLLGGLFDIKSTMASGTLVKLELPINS